jgi:DNA-binding GntR family transcriptional regulator
MSKQRSGRHLGPQQAGVYLSLRSAIEGGQLLPGQVIGSQAHLAQQQGVALATVHQALRVLEQDGYIVRRHGVGTFVADAPPMPRDPLRALARLTIQRFTSTEQATEAALKLLAEQIGVRSAFLSRFDHDQLVILADYDRDGCGIRAGSDFPLADAF